MSAKTKVTKTKTALKQELETYNLSDLKPASETNFSGDLRVSSPPSGGPRPEWPRFSFWGLVRSGSRSDSFRGPGRAECTEMHYSPGNLTRKGAGLPLLLLLFTLASRPLLRSPGPGLSFRGIAQWSRRTRAVTWRDSRGALHGTLTRDTALH